ncbi:MAG: 4Fe-4S binding protein [Deltaproteobacteria bacterium]|nr:4Fe-4S binding protein [Deltaproteobacteria bacterium]
MGKDIFRRLQEQLDKYSLGFPATNSGIEIKILKYLFTKQDAEMFLNLTQRVETPEQIAERASIPVAEVADKLSDMADRGLLFRFKKDNAVKYGAIPFVHGLFEFQVTRLDRHMAGLVKKYMEEGFENYLADSAAGFFRTIPVRHSIDTRQIIASYEDASEILKKVQKIVVAECICRKLSDLTDGNCDKPREVCFMFGSMGQYYLDQKMGREVDLDEALEILKKAQEAGLVTNPASSQNPGGMCNCCGDCCGVLIALNKHPRPAEMVFSNYFAEIEKDLCSGCGICEEKCQMGAITINEENIASINLDRCIGCGLCVVACPVEAAVLKSKPAEKRLIPPATTAEQMYEMVRKRGII